jgi:hypothetical protein
LVRRRESCEGWVLFAPRNHPGGEKQGWIAARARAVTARASSSGKMPESAIHNYIKIFSIEKLQMDNRMTMASKT